VITDGVIGLSRWDLTDAEWYATTASRDELIQRFTSEAPTLTTDGVRQAIAKQARRQDTASFLIRDALTGERLGNVALRHEDGIGLVSYWLAAAARGRGIATRALRLISRWAFEVLGLVELRLWTHVDNAASRGVAERAGYRRDPQRDRPRQVKGATWQTVAYRLVP
jgi:ribosomal-protein-alanine N-acetyltransferase